MPSRCHRSAALLPAKANKVHKCIWAIPGFLGLPSDWDVLGWNSLVGVDLYAFPWSTLSEWGRRFNRWVEPGREPKILMGYSLGGRLALHALLDCPEQWRAAIVVSAHTGLANFQEKEERRERDARWAERFRREEWSSLMGAWNAQELFVEDEVCFDRRECAYQRELLAQTLTGGSLARQENLLAAVASLPMPILWITGGRDRRFSEVAERIVFADARSAWISVAESGHRVPWNRPQPFAQEVSRFCADIGVSELV